NHVEGVIDRLQSGGFVAPDHSNIRQFNPQGDMGMANTIAKEIVNGPYDMVITSSTLALQTVAKANQNREKIHIFGAVTDPYGAGVGITGTKPGQHPSYMAGVGTFQPVAETFKTLIELNPYIKTVGVVWNSGEQCSTACLSEARLICDQLGITLVEAIATNTSEVAEALRSLLSKGVEAVWIGGDTVAMASLSMIINLSIQEGIPVFTNDPTDVKSGALFGLGADYFTVGQLTGDLAVAVLKGRKPSEISIENNIPKALSLNREILQSLGPSWNITPTIESKLSANSSVKEEKRITIDFAVTAGKDNKPTPEVIEQANLFLNVALKNGRAATVAIINLVENKLIEEAQDGVLAGLEWSGLRANQDYVIKKYSAQGEMSQLSQIIESVINEKPDVIVTVTTPAMIAMAKKITNIPVVFTVASDPAKLNIFKNGRPDNICGVHDNPPVAEVLAMAMDYIPQLKAVGTLYDPAQMNSALSVAKLRAAGKEQNIRVLEATASSVTELTMATQSLLQRGAQAIIISADNLANTGFSSIHRVAETAGIPIFTTEPQLCEQGATGAFGDSFFEWGKQAGKMAAKIIAGVPPSHLPITETEVQKRVDPKKQKILTSNKKIFKLRIVQYSETEFAERCQEGLLDGIARAGLKSEIDFELKSYNAQGDMSTLSSIMSTIKSDRVDLLMVISTPTLQAAIRQAGEETKIVFTGVGDGVKAGAGKTETDHLKNVTGITTRSPFDGMARLIHETMPHAKRVGTLFTPGEVNSVLYKDWFMEALAIYNIELVAIPVNSSPEVSQAAVELCQQHIQMIGQIVDNLTRPAFALIARKAAHNNLPVFVFDSDQMPNGGTICLARDYYDGGLEAAEKAVRVIRGENPGDIPFSNTLSERLLYNPQLTEKYNLQLPDSLKQKAIIFNQK
ncbi:MAG: ABC transporter substrate-binding protein, partial [Bacteroidales bacterium]|nr:ABC transporter substrate-binding protein [Bacteroidales bacterium]